MSLAMSCKFYRCRLSIFWVCVFVHISLICPLSVAISFTGFSSHSPSVLQAFHLFFATEEIPEKELGFQSHFIYSSYVTGSVLGSFYYFFSPSKNQRILTKALKRVKAITMNSLANKTFGKQNNFFSWFGRFEAFGKGYLLCWGFFFQLCLHLLATLDWPESEEKHFFLI